jgi:hypothetical protein
MELNCTSYVCCGMKAVPKAGTEPPAEMLAKIANANRTQIVEYTTEFCSSLVIGNSLGGGGFFTSPVSPVNPLIDVVNYSDCSLGVNPF